MNGAYMVLAPTLRGLGAGAGIRPGETGADGIFYDRAQKRR